MRFPTERSGAIVIKLKRKVHFRRHVYLKAVRPEFIMSALNGLKANNPLYEDIQIDCSNISFELTDTTHSDNDDTNLRTNTVNNHWQSTYENAVNLGHPCDAYFLENSELNGSVDAPNDRTEPLNEEVEDPFNEHRSPASETCLQSVIPDYHRFMRTTLKTP